MIRARACWHEHGEKSTKYFLNLEKRNHIKKHMLKLKIRGSITTDPFDILSEQQRFYQEECALLLETFQNNKTPGNDGIPIEFYRKFWLLISEPFTKCANECFEKGEMSRSQRQAALHSLRKRVKTAPS